MRICIYGAGAMGTSLGLRLEDAGYACDFVSRNETNIAAIRSRYGKNALLPEEMKGKYDVIFLATKQRENKAIAKFLERFLAADGALITVQNGLPEKGLAEVLGADRIYGCALSWGAEMVDGSVQVTSESGFHLALGAYGQGVQLEELKNMLKRIGEVTVGNLMELRFAKLATNASFSTLSAISGLTFGEISKKYKKQALGLIKETFAVAKACGCKKLPLNGHDLFKVFGVFGGVMLPIAMKKYKNTRSGMLKDLEAGRKCDVDFVAGAVVKAGQEKGVKTPNLKRAVALIHEIENGTKKIAPDTINLLGVTS